MKCTTVGLEQRMVYWHKLQFGFMIQTIAFGSSPDLPLKEGFNNSRYSAKKEGNEYSLEIRNVSKEDQGTYFCQAGTSYTMTFIYGSHLVLKGKQIVHFTLHAVLKQKENVKTCLCLTRIQSGICVAGKQSESAVFSSLAAREKPRSVSGRTESLPLQSRI